MSQSHAEEAARLIADRMGHTWAEITGKGRSEPLVTTRWMIYWIARRVFGLSYPAIGRMLHKDHSTICHGMNQLASGKRAIRRRLEVAMAGWKSRSGTMADVVAAIIANADCADLDMDELRTSKPPPRKAPAMADIEFEIGLQRSELALLALLRLHHPDKETRRAVRRSAPQFTRSISHHERKSMTTETH